MDQQPAAMQDFDPTYDRCGSKADITPSIGYVRFTPESGHRELASICPLSAKSGHNAVQQISTGLRSIFAVLVSCPHFQAAAP